MLDYVYLLSFRFANAFENIFMNMKYDTTYLAPQSAVFAVAFQEVVNCPLDGSLCVRHLSCRGY
jgi:hypothetical protein